MYEGKFITAAQKAAVAKRFESFIKSGFKRSLFSKNLYHYLMLHFGFIAHYNIDGFYTERFWNPQGRLMTFNAIANPNPWDLKDDNTSHCADLNTRLMEIAREYHERIVLGARNDELALCQKRREQLDAHEKAINTWK